MSTEEKVTRKLRAILSADVKGYSLLMADDEAHTVKKLKEYRDSMSGLIRSHSGRVVDAVGDNLLAEFSSAVDAVQCSVEIQKELKQKNQDLSTDRRLEFRIGINIGDVIQDGDRIYGGGVNVASRIEGLAEPGGICISRNAYDHIKEKLSFGYEYLGDHEVKNIKDPVRVYKVLVNPDDVGKLIGVKAKPPAKRWVWPIVIAVTIILTLIGYQVFHKMTVPDFEPASTDRMALPLPDKPSIAVLPFDNMSRNPDGEYFSDGLAEDIITALSKSSEIFVVARHSTFVYKGALVNIQKVAEELGVRYVLEGSFRKEGNKIRINAQLIDAIKGYHIWSENYDKKLENIFSIQDEITKNIISSLHVQLTIGEDARIAEKGTENLEAYLLYLKARELHMRFSKNENLQSRRLLEKVISIDPDYGSAYSLMAASHMMDIWLQATDSPKQSLKTAIGFAIKAKTLWDGSNDLLGFLYGMAGQLDNAIIECKKSVDLYPSSSTSHTFYGIVLNATGRYEEAISELEKSVRLDPFASSFSLRSLGFAYALAGRYDDAIKVSRKAVDKSPDDLVSNIFLTLSYSFAGRMEEAQIGSKEILRINPKFSLDSFVKRLIVQDQNQINRIKKALQLAGLPEHPPLHLPDKPSIAVLAFNNLSGDPEQEYFSDGISEDIITALSKTPKIFVIARNSSFSYKGKPVKIQQVGRDLGVRYVLEGSVRKAGEKVRITAQLIDAKTGHHIWADNYDRDLIDLFAVQDELTKKIISAMQVKLTSGEQARVDAKGTNNLQAFLKYLQARENVNRFNSEGNALGRQLAQEAIDLDPQYAMAYRILASTHRIDVFLGTSKSPKESIGMCFKLLNKSIQLDETYAEAYGALGFTFSMVGKHDKAVATAQKAVALDPNSANTYAMLGHTLRMADRSEEAIPAYKKAIRLNPIPPTFYLFGLGMSYSLAGQYEKGIKWCKKAVQQAPNDYIARIFLTTAFSMAGRLEDARAEVPEVLRINPKFSLVKAEKRAKYKYKDKMFEALRKVGLPE